MNWMRTDPRAEDVREIVQDVFGELVVAGRWSENDLDIEETIRIGAGRCTCRCFAIDGFSAVWVLGEGVLEFFDERKRTVRRVNLFKKVRPARIAA